MATTRLFVTIGLFLLLLNRPHVKAISTSEFYPFGSTNGDRRLTKNDDGSSGEVPISVPFPFFEERYTSLYVNTNGVISFLANLEEFTPDAFPVSNGRRLIAPFWADVDTRVGGDVFYREWKDLEMLQRATMDVKKYFPRYFVSFQASWVFVATWHNVSHFIRAFMQRGQMAQARDRNTFQAILTTNGRHSFAFFLYNKTEWTTGDASKGRNGEGGIPAQAGFNFGDGRRYYSVSGSRTRLIKQLPLLTNVGVPGKFAFRIDAATIENGGCNTGGGLTLSPRRGNVLGGTLITISGPCFNSSDSVVCRFNGTALVEGNFLSRYKVSCVSPPLNVTGKILLELSLDNGKTFKFSTPFASVPLGRHGPEISGLVAMDWTRINPLFLAWMPNQLGTPLVTIEVAKFDWKTLEILPDKILVKENVSNYGFETVRDLVQTALPMPNTSQPGSDKFVSPLSIVTIRAQSPARGPPARVYSAPFLAIPTEGNITKIKQAYDRLGIPRLCKQWFGEEDVDLDDIQEDLIGCPKSLEQAEADSGRFVSDDFCKPPRTGSCMTYQKGAYHCFRTVFPSPSGTGQHCCYTKQGNLLVGPPGGGTFDKAHPKSSRFATLKHLKEDIYPWYLCCRLEKKCGLYYENRPSDNGDRYKPPQIATTFGDPHLITLDGVSYTFNGYGEYTMLKIEQNGFTFQARMQPLQAKEPTQSGGTFLKAFALKDRHSDTLQIELNSVMMLDILVNRVEESFDPENKQLDFNGFMLTLLNDSTVRVIFQSGIVVNVRQNEVSLSFDMLLPESFKGKTKGLLGVWDDNKDNDFSLPDGQRIPITSNDSVIHWKFGQKWLTGASQSLFVYHNGKKYEDFVDNTYVPLFADDIHLKFVNKYQELKAHELCNGVKECLFDIIASGRLSVGNTTVQELERYNRKKEMINTVRVPIYHECGGKRVSDRCNACGNMCRGGGSRTVAIVLAVTFCLLAAAAAAVLLLYCKKRRRQTPPKQVEIPKPAPRKQIGAKPFSEPTAMAFVLPAFPESKRHKIKI